MPNSSRYCKAYPISRFEAFRLWPDNSVVPTDPQGDEMFLFLHDTLVVTTGVFVDEGVVYSSTSPEWAAFCADDLQFRVPEDVAQMDREGTSGAPPSAAAA